MSDKPDGRVIHGLATKHPLYRRWTAMRERCNNKNHVAYARYGGAGITICERWDNFAAFLEDMGDCPKDYSLERKDNSLGYSPENCVWASGAAQARNRSITVWIEYEGQKRCLADWASLLGISPASLKGRIKRWGLAIALSTPKQASTGKKFIHKLGL